MILILNHCPIVNSGKQTELIMLNSLKYKVIKMRHLNNDCQHDKKDFKLTENLLMRQHSWTVKPNKTTNTLKPNNQPVGLERIILLHHLCAS